VRDGKNAVVACSALRERYRAILGQDIPALRWVFLQADRSVLSARLHAREGHFAGPEILDSQLRELEPPHHVLTLRADLPVETLVAEIRARLGMTASSTTDG
jgi:carbohydrate kinase (thermoresistant glucokinase family)